ncbi:enoyl-CoA hydratase-related protein [Pyrinomonas sp.]|uniref:enoyl-CoA hydratase/isomerase family protein n=1 Tax=Pyrinomonas sp. TaxID=2080306 RepID=UPI00332D8BF4
MSENFDFIRLQIENGVGRITLARPPLNILHIPMMREMARALDRCMGCHEMVAIVFAAAPECRAFSAGVAVEDHKAETVYQMLDSFHNLFRLMEQMAKPTIAVVDGAALGGGFELVLGCDVVIASERARFGQPEIKLGVFPPIAAILLPRIIGEKRARELILTGDLIDSLEAFRLGVINHLVPSDQLQAKTEEVLDKLRELSAPALEATRRALDAARERTLEAALSAVEDIYLNELMKTHDAHEGIAAFLEKRKPQWRHR